MLLQDSARGSSPAGTYTTPDGEILVELGKQGATRRDKLSYPFLVGNFHRVSTPEFVFSYDLNGDIKYIRGLGRDWPHPSEWLKRSRGGEWVYYFSGRYTEDLYDALGEYYLPCFRYPSNSLWSVDPFREEGVQRALSAWKEVPRLLQTRLGTGAPSWTQELLYLLRERDETALQNTSQELSGILGDRIRVLPPDTRHVDYEVLPLIIADGCLYNCPFCRVKSGRSFRVRSQREAGEQLRGVERVFGRDLLNVNAVFLGQDDALHAGPDPVLSAARDSLRLLEGSPLQGRFLFLFASVRSLLQAPEELWSSLAELGCSTYVNVGLESADQESLDILGKPESASRVREAFCRMLRINERYREVEVTANFICDPDLPAGHWSELERLLKEVPQRPASKGAVYLSPRGERGRRAHMRYFQPLKRRSRLPMYLYLIQGL